MNEHIMKILFGNQKQAMKQNEAIVNFVDQFMQQSDASCYNVDTYDATATTIETNINFLLLRPEQWNLSEVLFMQYLLGVEACMRIKAGAPAKILVQRGTSSPKIVFTAKLLSEVEDVDVLKYEDERKNIDDALTAEDEAYRLIQEMVSLCPPAQRATLPEDDALAAILLSEGYWKVH